MVARQVPKLVAVAIRLIARGGKHQTKLLHAFVVAKLETLSARAVSPESPPRGLFTRAVTVFRSSGH